MRFFKVSSKFIFLVLFSASFSSYATDTSDCSKGGCIKVINENSKPLSLKIMPQTQGVSGENIKEYTIDLAANRETTFTVREDQVGSKIFKISGSTHSFTPNGTCENLNISDNYELTLTNDKVGTTCHAQKGATGASEGK